VLSVDISDSRVGAIYNQINPGKLSHLAARRPRTSSPATPADQVTGGRGEGRKKAE